MKLFYKKTGEGKPLIILHGLFGLSDNWATISKSFVENGFCCYLVDLRNHGRTPHSDDFTYEIMADDILELMDDENIVQADIIGHSMGGKAAMFFALKFPERIRKMVVVDISPRYYPQHHQAIFSTLKSIDLKSPVSRKEVEEKLRSGINDEATLQFLLKNLFWVDDKHLNWRFGFLEIERNIEEVGKELPHDSKIDVPTLFLRGEKSGYVSKDDETEIKAQFSSVEIKTVSNAGHWVHAENPKGFLDAVLDYLTQP
jgi:esterase